jgi:hypothetical protein
LYSKSGGQKGKHAAVIDASRLAAVSHVGLQIFGHRHGRWFTHIPEETAHLQTKRFALLAPQNFLLLLHSPVPLDNTQLVQVSLNDIGEHDEMTARTSFIETALLKYKED